MMKNKHPVCTVMIYPVGEYCLHAVILTHVRGKTRAMAVTAKPFFNKKKLLARLKKTCGEMACCDLYVSQNFEGNANCFFLEPGEGPKKSWSWHFPRHDPVFVSEPCRTKNDAWRSALLTHNLIPHAQIEEE